MSYHPEVNYRSPFDTDPPSLPHSRSEGEHWQWCCYRDAWANSGNDYHLKQMLAAVTLDNPPDAPKETTQAECRWWPTVVLVLLLVAGAALGITFTMVI